GRRRAVAHSLAPARPPFRNPRAHGRADPSARRRSADVIRYALQCEARHGFESWFSNSAAFDRQAARGLVTCPLCGSAKVEKAIMAPALGAGGRDAVPTPAPAEPE